jgi:MYXO-CTERM domain-containing protein
VPTVTFLLDGATELAVVATRPFEISWDPATAGEGAHALGVRAVDPGGVAATHEVHVSVTRGGATGDCTTRWGGDADADADADAGADADAVTDADIGGDADASDVRPEDVAYDAYDDGSCATFDDGPGCSCRVSGAFAPSSVVVLLAFPALFLFRRRRSPSRP